MSLFAMRPTLTAAVLALSLSSVSMLSQAATASQTSVVKLMQVTHVDEMMDQMLAQNDAMLDQMVGHMVASNADSQLTEAQTQQITSIASKYSRQMLQQMNTPQMRQQITDAYVAAAQQHYTQAEVDAQIAFYGSDVGQSIISKQSDVMQDYMGQIMPSMLQQMQATMQQLMPKMEAEIKAALQ